MHLAKRMRAKLKKTGRVCFVRYPGELEITSTKTECFANCRFTSMFKNVSVNGTCISVP